MSIGKRVKKTVKSVLKPTVLAAAMLGCASSQAGLLGNLLNINNNVNAGALVTVASVGMDFTGWITMLNSTGTAVNNPDFADEPRFFGNRTPVSGRMVFNITESGLVGAASFEPFDFIGIQASGRNISIVPAHEILGLIPTDTLFLANMSFDYGISTGIPVSLVIDMGGLTTALRNTFEGEFLQGLLTAESENTVFQTGKKSFELLPMGPVIAATTSWNTTDVDTDGDNQPGPVGLEDNPSGTTPLLVDTTVDATNGDIGIGGSPMRAGPFTGFNANFDIQTLTVTCVSALLSDCETGGLVIPPVLTLDPQPLQPLLELLGIF
jgi:hypothetical protein